jgi:ADP-ribosylglycohydrolase
MHSITKDKIKGIFFGQAIGDALGLGTEFMLKQQVQQNYPDGLNHYSQIIQDNHRSRWKKGNWTDDTDQFLCILNSILHKGHIDLNNIAYNFKEWLANNGMGIGQTTYKVLTLPQYEIYPKKAAELVWKLKKRDNAPNGALMRNSIVCTYNYWNQNQVLYNCKNVCQLTHFDNRCVDSCQIMALIITAELNNSTLNWKQLKSEFSHFDTRINEYIETIDIPVEKLKLDDQKTLGYTLKALYAGLWAYYNSNNFLHGLNAVIMEGGDADTNGCIAGSMLGAKFGFSQIPDYLVEELNHKNELYDLYEKYITKLENNQTTT